MIDFNNILEISENREFGFQKIKEKGIIFYVPKQLIPNEEINNTYDYFQKLKLYILVLLKYSKSKSDEIKYDSEDKEYNLSVIEGYLNILDDYFKNEEFYLFEQFYSKDKNKINWSKTIRNNEIIVSNGAVVYKDFLSNNERVDDHSEFYKLYKNALNASFQLFLGLDTEEVLFDMEESEALYHISKYEDTHFRDRELFIASNLKKIYTDNMFSNYNSEALEVKYHTKFENVWEFMIESLIPEKYNLKDLQEKVKKGKYLIDRDGIESTAAGLDLRLDHIANVDNHIHILDSKFYNSEDNKFPQTGDIGKQILYRDYIKRIADDNVVSISNNFIFPKKDSNNKISYIGIHLVEDIEDYTIKCWELDIDYVLNCL